MANTILLPQWMPTMNRALTLGVRYGFGEKFDHVADPTPHDEYVDCSGFVRWATYHASGGTELIPDGSVNQRYWCIARRFEKVNYGRAVEDKSGRVYLAFIRPRGRRAGHVWFVRHGITWESFSGRGIGNRKAWYPSLNLLASDCYILAHSI